MASYLSNGIHSVEKSSKSELNVDIFLNAKRSSLQKINANNMCLHCHGPLEGQRSSKQFCSTRCRMKAAYRRKTLERHGIVEGPLCLQGPFQSYQHTYRGKIDVIMTDPPYGREYLSLYKDLAHFALETLYPGGWLLCLTGWGLDWDIRKTFNDAGLEYLTVCTYLMMGATLHSDKYTSTGRRRWAQQAKPLLWYQKPGTKLDRRRAGTSDLIRAGEPLVIEGANTQSRQDFHWQQCLEGMKQMVWNFANPQDVICDPCMGSGTTLVAAYLQNRKHVIGIEKDAEVYGQAVQRLAAVR